MGPLSVQNNRPEGYANYLPNKFYLACGRETIMVRRSSTKPRRKRAGRGKGNTNANQEEGDDDNELCEQDMDGQGWEWEDASWRHASWNESSDWWGGYSPWPSEQTM